MKTKPKEFVSLAAQRQYFGDDYMIHAVNWYGWMVEQIKLIEKAGRPSNGEPSSHEYDIAEKAMRELGLIPMQARSREAIAMTISDALRAVADSMGDDLERKNLERSRQP